MSLSRLSWLRSQLQIQLQRRSGPQTPAPTDRRPTLSANPLPRMTGLKARQVQEEAVLVAALLEDLLDEGVGQGLENDPAYRLALAEVLSALQDDPELWALCRQCVAE